MEYLIYHLRPYGVNAKFVTKSGQMLSKPSLSDDEIVASVRQSAMKNRGAEDKIDNLDEQPTKRKDNASNPNDKQK